jgi:LacI family transcriptional regulator
MMKNRHPTQNDVAKAAGVSQSLVSLVLGESGAPVSKETRMRILDAAQRIGFTSKNRRKKNRNRKLLAYIRPALESEQPENRDIHNSYIQFYNHIQNSLVEQTYTAGYELIVRPYSRPADLTHWLIEWGVDGVFLHSGDESLSKWIASRFTMIQINRHLRVNADSVIPDQEDIVLTALNHLRQFGHERIALISHARADFATKLRNRAYLEYTRVNKLPCFEGWIAENSIEKIVSMLAERSPAGPTALVVGDYSALLIQDKLQRIGFSLPQDLSLVGIDNISASQFSSPRLTSVDIQIEEITHAALTQMTSRLEDPESAFQKIEIRPKLFVRDSVAMKSPGMQHTS